MASPVDRLVHALKYEGWYELAEEMGGSMAALELPDSGGPPELVVPVPTTARRLRERGYNQAELLARVVAERRGLPLATPLVRVRGGATQVSLAPTQRRANVAGAFRAAADRRTLEAHHVLLVDDVLTTGATAGAAAAALLRSGARHVSLVTFARALPFSERSER